MNFASFFTTIKHFLWFYKPTEGRFIHLGFINEGFKRSGIPWVEYDGSQLIPFCAADDIGIYWLIPRIAHALDCSVERAICIFFYGSALFSWTLGIIGFFLLYRSVVQRFVAFIGLSSLLLLTLYIGDVYILYSSAAMALMPLGMYLSLNDTKPIYYGIFGVFAGLFMGITHLGRSYSAVPPLLFVLILCWFQRDCARSKKGILTCAIFLGLMSVVFFTHQQKNRYHAYIQQNYPTAQLDNYQHGIWHTIYCGLGFFKFMNKRNIEWNDSCAQNFIEKMKQNKKNADLSGEHILKTEIINIMRNESHFMVFSLFGKIGVLILFLLLSAQIGLIAAFIVRKPLVIDLSFFIALAISAVFPLLAMPFLTYGLSFISCAVLYNIVSINYAYAQLIQKHSTNCA